MATLKTCFKCGEEKSTADFYRHPRMGDGLLGKCKECTKSDVRSNRAANSDYYREYDIERAKTDHRKAFLAESLKRIRQRWPEKNRARGLVSKAIRSGKISALPCWVCGSEQSEAHHPDYSMPLDVVWLCREHHKQLHAMTKESA